MREIKPLSFIYEIEEALARDICREMIRRFEEKRDQQYPGRISSAEIEQPQIKKSTDLHISGRPDWKDIDRSLARSMTQAFNKIRTLFPFFGVNSFKDIGYNMQRTLPDEYYHWHIDSGPGEFSQRQLVAIWYLNTVEGPGGETEFMHQNVKIKPVEGKLVLFPPFWTHDHRGAVLDRGIKYIATTWIYFA